MDFNEANNVLARVKREYRAWEKLEELITFCVDLDQKKAQLGQEILALQEERDKAAELYKIQEGRVAEVELLVKVTEESAREAVREINAEYAAKKDALIGELETSTAWMKEDLDKLVAKINDHKLILRDLEDQIKHEESRLAEVRRSYEDFKKGLN
jgi:chromosome segregation ATPase